MVYNNVQSSSSMCLLLLWSQSSVGALPSRREELPWLGDRLVRLLLLLGLALRVHNREDLLVHLVAVLGFLTRF